VPISDGAWATRCRRVNRRLAHRVAARLTRLWRSRLSGRDDTGARGHGRPPGAGVVQHPDGGGPVLRPSPGHGGLPDILGDQRPTLGVSARSRAPPQHPAAPWPVCCAHPGRDGPLALAAGAPVCAPRMQAVCRRAVALPTRRDPCAASTRSQSRCARPRHGGRCRTRQPANPHGRRVQTRSAKLQGALCGWLDEVALPPTHHARAPALRRSPVVRTGTHGLRSAGGRDRSAAVRSVVHTGTRQGLAAYQAIQTALAPLGS
jgi:hypothetical protein